MDKATKSAASKKLKSKRASAADKTMAALAMVAARKKKPPRVFGTAPQLQRISELEAILAELLNDPHGDTDVWSRARVVLKKQGGR